MDRQHVGVVGASARAAAMSLLRAGFSPWAVDLFADRDLKRIAPTKRCPFDRYPDALPELCDGFPPGPVLYTGGLENYPDVVRELATRRPLWGNGPDVLERVRDPFRLAENGFAVPPVLPTTSPPSAGRWLRKPLRSAGGLGIRFARPDDEPSPNHYLQEFVPGPARSAIFVNEALMGVTEQLIGVDWLHAKPFAYAGNIGSVMVPFEMQPLGLCGPWGMDFIQSPIGPVLIEVNPRYTAAVEVLEHALGVSAWGAVLGERRGVSPPCSLLSTSGLRRDARHVIGKAIYFAPDSITFPAAGPWDADLAGDFDPWRLPAFADIPEVGEVIEAGSPVLTFFVQGSTADDCRAKLMRRAADLNTLFSREPQTSAETSR